MEDKSFLDGAAHGLEEDMIFFSLGIFLTQFNPRSSASRNEGVTNSLSAHALFRRHAREARFLLLLNQETVRADRQIDQHTQFA